MKYICIPMCYSLSHPHTRPHSATHPLCSLPHCQQPVSKALLYTAFTVNISIDPIIRPRPKGCNFGWYPSGFPGWNGEESCAIELDVMKKRILCDLRFFFNMGPYVWWMPPSGTCHRYKSELYVGEPPWHIALMDIVRHSVQRALHVSSLSAIICWCQTLPG